MGMFYLRLLYRKVSYFNFKYMAFEAHKSCFMFKSIKMN